MQPKVGDIISWNNLIGFQEVQNLGSYLGVPLLHDRVTISTLNFMMEKVRHKLQSWEARKLSITGRITLAQFILISILNYFMQSMLIPKRICTKIEQLSVNLFGVVQEVRRR